MAAPDQGGRSLKHAGTTSFGRQEPELCSAIEGSYPLFIGQQQLDRDRLSPASSAWQHKQLASAGFAVRQKMACPKMNNKAYHLDECD
jgi:hypothetical protein